jgi:POT family proton-dependent oligopeptide transporter
VLMGLATIVFWMGRKKFVHIPGRPGGKLGVLDALSGTLLFVGALGIWLFGPSFEVGMGVRVLVSALSLGGGVALFFYRQHLAPDDSFLATVMASLARGPKRARAALGEEAYDGMLAVFRAMSVIGFIVVFWSLYDQKDSTWVLQADHMNRTFTLPVLGWSFTILTAQVASTNSVLVLVLIPFSVLVVFPWLERRGIQVTPIRRMAVGLFLTASSFVVIALLQHRLDAGAHVHWAWQIIAYLLMTTGEVLVSATGVEFAYTQAPRRMKSTLMAMWYLMVTFGNLFVVLVLAITKGKPQVTQFWLFAAIMGVTAVLFSIRIRFYKSREYPQ